MYKITFSLVSLSLALASPLPVYATTDPSAADGPVIVFAPDSEMVGRDIVSQCVMKLEQVQSHSGQFYVQFTRAVRPRKIVVETANESMVPDTIHRLDRSGRVIDITAITVSEMSSGRVTFKAEVSTDARRTMKDPERPARAICDVIRQSATAS